MRSVDGSFNRGSKQLNIASISNQLNVAQITINRWVQTLQSFYFCFAIKLWFEKKQEVDFLVSKNGRPWFLVEVNKSDKRISESLSYYQGLLAAEWIKHALYVIVHHSIW